MTAIGRITVIALDCPEPSALAKFYSAITGWPIDPSGHPFCLVRAHS